MMKHIKHSIMMLLLVGAIAAGTAVHAAAQDTTVKKERNHIRSGNKLYNEKRYAEAEVEYNKALQAHPGSPVATFNLATTLLRQGNSAAAKDDKNNPVNRAEGLLQQVLKGTIDPRLQSKAYYDLGNIAYGRQDYDQAIEYYKSSLRRNPNDDDARKNLRLAQLKKKQQDQNQDQNKDKNKDQDKDQQNQDQQQQNNKDKERQQQQDQDKQNQDQQNQNKDKQDQQQGNQGNQQNQQGQQGNQQQGVSQQGAEQILKTMQNQENATQQKIQALQARQQQRERSATSRKW